MPNFKTQLGSQDFEQVRQLNAQAAAQSPQTQANGLDEIVFDVDGERYIGASESLQLNQIQTGDKLQIELAGESREGTVIALDDEITSMSEGWSKGSSISDSFAKAYAGMMSSPDWSSFHGISHTVGRWPQAETAVPVAPTAPPITDPVTPQDSPRDSVTSVDSPPEIAPIESSQIEVFFSRGNGPSPDQKLAEFILSADTRVDIAAFELESAVVRDAILEAHRNQRQVRVVTDDRYKDEHDIHLLQEAGIEVVDDDRSGLMHNKFVVIDQGEADAAVWMGSMNFTDNGVHRNDNNAQIIRSTELADNYTAEFNEMFEARQFGIRSPQIVPHPSITVGRSQIDTHFAAEGRVIGEVAKALNTANESIHFMTFAFTHDAVGDVVSQKMRDGLTVRGVFDHQQAGSRYSQYHRLKAEGADVKRDGNPKFLHHKVFIIDGKTVVTGSFNFSKSADKSNDENLLIIEDEALAQQYLAEFERVYAESAQNPSNH